MAYLLGSMPSAVWISKGIYGSDVRTYGSGNAGSTNMFRIFGFKAGMATQLIDLGKGMLAAALPWFFVKLFPGQFHHFSGLPFAIQSMITGLAAVIGHIYPVFAGFKGGKGVNTLLGMLLISSPLTALVCLGVFVLTVLLSSFVSLGSLLGTLTFSVFHVVQDLIAGEPIRGEFLGLGLGMFALVVFTHRANVSRILQGKENRAGFVDKLMGRKKD